MHSLFLHKKLPINMHAYSDVDWAGNPSDRSFTSAHIVFLGHNPIAWSSKKQKSIVRSSIEAKYRAMVSIASKVLWVKCFFFFFLQNLMFQFHHHLLSIVIIWVQYIFVQIQCFAMQLIFILLETKFNHVSLGSHVSIMDQLADVLTNKAPIFYMSSSPYLLYEFKPYILEEFKPFESRLTHLEGVYWADPYQLMNLFEFYNCIILIYHKPYVNRRFHVNRSPWKFILY